MEFSRGFTQRVSGKFIGQLKNEVEFPWVLKKNSCEISMGPGLWPSNFQWLPHNFA